MVTESVVDNISPVPLAITSGALAADLLADSADLLDVAATLNVEFRRVVAELRRAPGSGVIGRLARKGHIPLGYHKDPSKTAATFVESGGVRWVLLTYREPPPEGKPPVNR